MRFRPGEQMAQLMWANQFRGDPIGLAKLFEAQASDITSSSLANRNVRTTDARAVAASPMYRLPQLPI